ncbi:hypothetical protein IC582_021917 [Cucumis melo]
METVLENSIPGLSDSIAKIREDVKSGVGNLTEVCVSTMADVTRLLMKSIMAAHFGNFCYIATAKSFKLPSRCTSKLASFFVFSNF